MDNDILLERQNKNLLFDFYGALLTEKQREIFALSNLEDCSFAEISKELEITPQAVGDFVKRAAAQLEKYEKALGLVEKFSYQKQLIQDIETGLDELCKADEAEISGKITKIKTTLGQLLI